MAEDPDLRRLHLFRSRLLIDYERKRWVTWNAPSTSVFSISVQRVFCAASWNPDVHFGRTTAHHAG